MSYTTPDKRWKVRLWGQNLADKTYYSSFSHAEYGDQAGPGTPRTYGVTAEYNFGG